MDERFNLSEVHVFRSYEEVESFMNVYETTNCVLFSNSKSSKGFGTFDIKKCDIWKKMIYWPDDIPVMMCGSKMLQCRHRIPCGKESKRLSLVREHTYGTKGHTSIADLRDDRCPAKIYIKEVLKFPDFKAHNITRSHKEKINKQIKDAVTEDCDSVTVNKVFYCEIPHKDMHVGHSLGNISVKNQDMDNFLSSEIRKLAHQGITDPEEVKKHLIEAVEAITVIPVNKENGKFYKPSSEVYDQIKNAKRVSGEHSEDIDEIVVIHVS